MSNVSKPNTFSANTTISASEVNDNFDTIYNEFNGSISAANLATDSVTTAKIADSNITTAKIADANVTAAKLADMGTDTTATTTGITSITTNVLQYTKVGNTVLVTFFVQGTSNSVSKTLTLPYAPNNGPIYFPIHARDNSVNSTGVALVASGSTTLDCYKNAAGDTWTNSGQCRIGGSFSYLTDA